MPLANAPERAPSPLQSDTEIKPNNPDEKPNEKPDEKSLDRSDRSENGVGPVPSGPLTIEGLKAEVEADVTASGHDSAYDRMFFFSVIVNGPLFFLHIPWFFPHHSG